MADLLNISGLSKSYGSFALRDVNLRVPEGCITGFVGANGAGKTTTIKAMLGLVRPDAGTVELFGERADAAGPDPQLKERLGVVLDSCPFPGDMRVHEVGKLGRSAFPTWNDDAYKELLARFAIEQTKQVKDLSRGMGMKLQLAFALAHAPDLLVLDEPTSGLDPLAREDVIALLRDYMEGGRRGVLMSSHITTDLEKIADWVVCIDNGRMAFEKSIDEIRDGAGIARCKHSEVGEISAVFGEGSLRAAFNGYSADVLVPDRMALRRAIPHIACERPTLEEYMALALKGEAL